MCKQNNSLCNPVPNLLQSFGILGGCAGGQKERRKSRSESGEKKTWNWEKSILHTSDHCIYFEFWMFRREEDICGSKSSKEGRKRLDSHLQNQVFPDLKKRSKWNQKWNHVNPISKSRVIAAGAPTPWRGTPSSRSCCRMWKVAVERADETKELDERTRPTYDPVMTQLWQSSIFCFLVSHCFSYLYFFRADCRPCTVTCEASYPREAQEGKGGGRELFFLPHSDRSILNCFHSISV